MIWDDHLARYPLHERFAYDVNSYIGRRLKSARMSANMSQARLAEAAGVHISSISRIENGLRDVTVAELIRLAIASRRRLDYFLVPADPEVVKTGWEPPPPPPQPARPENETLGEFLRRIGAE